MNRIAKFLKWLYSGAKQEDTAMEGTPPEPVKTEQKKVINTNKKYTMPTAPEISYSGLKNIYNALWETMEVRPEKLQAVLNQAAKVKANKEIYEAINYKIQKDYPSSKIPWYFIGLVHLMECTLSFSHHLHNGDPLKARTVHVPAGRPVKGQPPFSFLESAVDALTMQGLHREENWGVDNILFKLEAFNGYGYTMYRNMPSPYLWAGSNHYEKGKYIADGKFDKEAVSSQIGTALILKQLIETT